MCRTTRIAAAWGYRRTTSSPLRTCVNPGPASSSSVRGFFGERFGRQEFRYPLRL
jgi:hypothetical protein